VERDTEKETGAGKKSGEINGESHMKGKRIRPETGGKKESPKKTTIDRESSKSKRAKQVFLTN